MSSIRYMSQAKHAEARELMHNGALLFFSYNQVQASLQLLPPPPTRSCQVLNVHVVYVNTPDRRVIVSWFKAVFVCCFLWYNCNTSGVFRSYSRMKEPKCDSNFCESIVLSPYLYLYKYSDKMCLGKKFTASLLVGQWFQDRLIWAFSPNAPQSNSLENMEFQMQWIVFSSPAKQCSRPVHAGAGGVGEIGDKSWRRNIRWVAAWCHCGPYYCFHSFQDSHHSDTKENRTGIELIIFRIAFIDERYKSTYCGGTFC